MKSRGTYLDYNATAPMRLEATEAVRAAMEVCGNPSSVHGFGRAARRIMEDAREAVAALVGASPRDVVFTSGGAEANALALAPVSAGERLLVSATEHPSVLNGGRFPPEHVETIPVDGEGLVDLDWLAARLERSPSVGLVSVMAVNSETGVIQPIARVAELAHAAGARMHADCVQAAGRTPLDIAALGVDLLTLSAHKLGGPPGVGALVKANGARVTPLIRGGGQERSQRAGTENVIGIAGFGAAVGALEDIERLSRLRDWLEGELGTISGQTRFFGAGAPRVANTTCFAVPGIAAEKAVIALDLEGVAVSSGSACSSGKVGPSHVLAAMGVPSHLADGAIRVSLGWASSEEDVTRFLAVWRRVSAALGRGRDRAA